MTITDQGQRHLIVSLLGRESRALGDAKLNVGSSILLHTLTVIDMCKILDWSALNW